MNMRLRTSWRDDTGERKSFFIALNMLRYASIWPSGIGPSVRNPTAGAVSIHEIYLLDEWSFRGDPTLSFPSSTVQDELHSAGRWVHENEPPCLVRRRIVMDELPSSHPATIWSARVMAHVMSGALQYCFIPPARE
jgi:hypothetical protein